MNAMEDPTTSYESYSSINSLDPVANLRKNLGGLTLHDGLEVLFSLAVLVMCYLISLLWESGYEWERPLPYQKLDDGGVVIDLALAYPLVSSTVSTNMLVLTCGIIPLALMVAIGLCAGPRHDAKSMFCASGVAFGLNFLITHSLKEYCGYFRPNLYEMCQFSEETLQCESESQGGLSNARHSFPSGHASTAFLGTTLLTLMLLGKAGLHTAPTSITAMLRTKLFAILSIIPMLYATFVAASRVHDFMHHPADVGVGALIGFSCANFAYSLWYPSIYSTVHPGVPLQFLHEDKDQEGEGLLVNETQPSDTLPTSSSPLTGHRQLS